MTPSQRFWLFGGVLIAGTVVVVISVRIHGESLVRKRDVALKQLATIPEENPPVDPEALATGNAPPPEDVSGRINDYTARISEAAAAMNPNERKALMAAQRVFTPMVRLMAAYERSFKELHDAGVTSPATLDSIDALKERIAMVQRLAKANHSLLDFYRNAEKNYRAELGKEDLPENVKNDALGGFKRGSNLEVNLIIRECEEQNTGALLKILQLLTREWEAWKVEPAGELAFERDPALAEYMALQETLRLTSQRQEAAQKDLRKRSEQPKK